MLVGMRTSSWESARNRLEFGSEEEEESRRVRVGGRGGGRKNLQKVELMVRVERFGRARERGRRGSWGWGCGEGRVVDVDVGWEGG